MAAIPFRIIENKRGGYNTRMSDEKPAWLIGTAGEVERKWFFAWGGVLHKKGEGGGTQGAIPEEA